MYMQCLIHLTIIILYICTIILCDFMKIISSYPVFISPDLTTIFNYQPIQCQFTNDPLSKKVLIALPVALHPPSYQLLISLELREIRGESSRRRERRAALAFRSHRLRDHVQSSGYHDLGFDHSYTQWTDNA